MELGFELKASWSEVMRVADCTTYYNSIWHSSASIHVQKGARTVVVNSLSGPMVGSQLIFNTHGKVEAAVSSSNRIMLRTTTVYFFN